MAFLRVGRLRVGARGSRKEYADPVPFFLLVYLLVFEKHRVSTLNACRNIFLMIFAMLIVLLPWIIRNYSLPNASYRPQVCWGCQHMPANTSACTSPRTSLG